MTPPKWEKCAQTLEGRAQSALWTEGIDMHDSSIVIETRNITKRFKEVLAVDSLSMNVRKGEIYGFLGPNGAGKSTTIKMIMGLFHPTSGEAFINGKLVNGGGVELRRDVGFLPERISFYDNLTPIQTLNFFCELRDVDKSVVPSLLRDVGLDGAANRKVGTFSKGMTQLLGMAQAMIGNPSIYVMDEPTGGLDARWVKAVREKLRTLNEQGATIIFSSHILSEVQALCHRVAIINNGRLVAEDTIDNISGGLHIRPRLWVQSAGLNEKILSWVREIEGVEDVAAKGDAMTITCDASMRLRVMTAMQERGLVIKDFRTVEPTLEEAFVKLLSEDGEP
ncbi:MAG: ABC transporter ATP-binding protein [Candidatus Thermoplasmatota archaeon]|nr:ABC transporter ATP-binding protein [Candidatus Thermoplasmatota archaeon]